MRARHADRLWAVGGALGAVVLLAVGWFFFVGPQRSETSALREQAIAAQDRVSVLQRRLVELREQKADLPRYEAQLARQRQALPATDGMSDFLRELQAIGELTHVEVSGFIVGAPAQVTGVTGQVYALPIALTAAGTTDALNAFLDQLQRVQPRAVLITNANASAATEEDGSVTNDQTLALSLKAFVAPNLNSASGTGD
jgi:Tfp pilus assembly protein PilO